MKDPLQTRYERSLDDLRAPSPPLYKRLAGVCYLGARAGASDFEMIAEIRHALPDGLAVHWLAIDLALDRARERMADEITPLFDGPICPCCRQPQPDLSAGAAC